jgi:5-methylcytosine-specific restriction endonuclease McrA
MLLERYDYSCCYCGKRFGAYVDIKNKTRQIRVSWDHEIPFSYSMNNAGDNFLPACSICNGWKSNKMFQTMEEVKLYVNNLWEKAKASIA